MNSFYNCGNERPFLSEIAFGTPLVPRAGDDRGMTACHEDLWVCHWGEGFVRGSSWD